ncbi:MAG: LysR family transcriptional regulator [Steroidobacterales bacterium]
MINPTLRQMRCFVSIVAEGSFTAAAARLHLTQSATSAVLRDLEAELGITLIDRTTRSVRLSAAGEQFLGHARRILRDVDEAVADVKGLVDKSHGVIRVAASPLASVILLPQILESFRATYPGVRVELHDVLTAEILDQVRRGDVDIGIGTFLKSATELTLVTLFEDRLGLVMPRASPIARRRFARWQDLVDQDVIALTRGSAFRASTDATVQQLGLAVKPPVFEVGYMGTAVALAEAGLGICVLPTRAARLIRSRRAVFRPLRNPVVTQAATLVTKADRSLSPAARAFVSFLSAKRLAQA